MSGRSASISQVRRSAFTLVELLIVIGIIALLLSIMLPVVARAREAANSARCLSNLRQLGAATFQYVHDSRGHVFPHSYRESDPPVYWVHILVNGGYFKAPPQVHGAQNSAGDSIFRCPSGIDSPYAASTGYTALDRAHPCHANFREYTDSNGTILHNWYGLNQSTGDAVDPDGDYATAPFRDYPALAGSNVRTDRRIHKFSDFRRTSSLVLMTDGAWSDNRSGYISARHNKWRSANMLMADGHAESVRVDRMPRTYQDLYRQSTSPIFYLK